MLPRIVVLFACIGIALSFSSDSKNPEDEEGFKISLEKLKFIPAELLCTLCHNVVTRLQHDLLENPLQFQINMLKSCDNYPELEDKVKCRSAFQNKRKIEMLLEPNAPTKMCRTKKLCGEDELPLPPNAFPAMGPRPLPSGMRPIPENQGSLKPNEEPSPVVPADPPTFTDTFE